MSDLHDPIADVPEGRVPRHVAVIMDGNGRWAVKRGHERVRGHDRGAEVVPELVTDLVNLRKARPDAVDVLTLYSFSVENWKRPADEVATLMQMYVDYLRRERPRMVRENVRFRQIGRDEELPPVLRDELAKTLDVTAANDGLTLCLALNYGSRTEITDAVRRIATLAADGELDPARITERTVAEHLYTADLPDPDLVIRTAGEMRISNYLLWQISYAELVVSDVLWPDFGPTALHECIREYAGRNRRYGALDATNTLTATTT